MKSIGIIRKVDKMGRIVIPSELRQLLGIAVEDDMEIYSEGDRVVLQKFKPNCTFCGSTEELKLFSGKCICASCMKTLREQ